MRVEKLKMGEFEYYAHSDWNGYAIVVKKWRRGYRYFNLFSGWFFHRVLKIGFDLFIDDEANLKREKEKIKSDIYEV